MIVNTTRSFSHSALLCLLAPLAFMAPGVSHASVCDGFYAANFALAQGKLNPTMASMAKPAKGARFKEPNFGTCVVRATAHDVEPPKHFARNDYSRRQAFNANNTYFLIYSDGGVWNLYDANTLKYIRALTPLAGDAEAQWHPTDPNTLYYLPTSGGTKLMKLDVRTNTSSVAVDFVGKLPSWASSAAHIWTQTEGGPSADARYWGFVDHDNSYKTLGFIVWDLQQNKLVGSKQDSASYDNVSISAKGRWFVATGNEVWAWSPDFTKKKKLANLGGVHTDLAIGPNGQDYFISADFQSDGGDIYFVDLDACPSVSASATSAPVCPRTTLFSMYKDGGWATPHFSAKAFNKPGWLLLSMYDSGTNGSSLPWFTNKVMAVELKASPKILPLAYTHRVKVTSGDTDGAGNYWSEPHGSVNRDFTRIIFNSNWGNSVGADVDAYIIELPANALGGSTGGGATGPSTGGNLPPVLGKGSNGTTAPVTSTSAPTPVSAGSGSSSGSTSTTPVFSLGCRMCDSFARAKAAWLEYAEEAMSRNGKASSMAAKAERSLYALPAIAAHSLTKLAGVTTANASVKPSAASADRSTSSRKAAAVSILATPSRAKTTCLSTRGIASIETDFAQDATTDRECLLERSAR